MNNQMNDTEYASFCAPKFALENAKILRKGGSLGYFDEMLSFKNQPCIAGPFFFKKKFIISSVCSNGSIRYEFATWLQVRRWLKKGIYR